MIEDEAQAIEVVSFKSFFGNQRRPNAGLAFTTKLLQIGAQMRADLCAGQRTTDEHSIFPGGRQH
jgi:hypothetical protein